MISFQALGIEKATRALARTRSRRTMLMRSPHFFSRTAGRVMREAMMDVMPEKSGELKKSLKVHIEHGEESSVTFSAVEHARYVIEGTHPHEIWPAHAAILSNYHTGAGDFAAAYVLNHPGTVANDFRKLAWRYARPEITAAMKVFGFRVASLAGELEDI